MNSLNRFSMALCLSLFCSAKGHAFSQMVIEQEIAVEESSATEGSYLTTFYLAEERPGELLPLDDFGYGRLSLFCEMRIRMNNPEFVSFDLSADQKWALIPKGTVLEISEAGTKRPSFMNQSWSRFYRSEMNSENSVTILCSEHSSSWLQILNPVTISRLRDTFRGAVSLQD